MSREIIALYLPCFSVCASSLAAVGRRILSQSVWSSCCALPYLSSVSSPSVCMHLVNLDMQCLSAAWTVHFFPLLYVGIQSRQDEVVCIYSGPTDLGAFVIISFLLSLVSSQLASISFLSFFHSARADYFFQEAEIWLFRPFVPLLVNYLAPRKSYSDSLTLPGNKTFLSLVPFPVSTLFIFSRNSDFLLLCW